MIHWQQYRPAFFEGFTNAEGDCATVTELLALPFIDAWKSESSEYGVFYRFSKSNHGAYYTLMCELKAGTEWWVVAILKPDNETDLADLPEWIPSRQHL